MKRWQAEGACGSAPDPEVFWDPERELEALAFCGGCSVRRQCLEWSLQYEPWGVWGGFSEGARAELRRRFGVTLSLEQEKKGDVGGTIFS